MKMQMSATSEKAKPDVENIRGLSVMAVKRTAVQGLSSRCNTNYVNYYDIICYARPCIYCTYIQYILDLHVKQ
jgi:hypothetical protein